MLKPEFRNRNQKFHTTRVKWKCEHGSCLIYIVWAKNRTQLTSWPDPARVGSTPRVGRVPVRIACSTHYREADWVQFPEGSGTRLLVHPSAWHSLRWDWAPWWPDMDSRGWRSWSTSSEVPSTAAASHRTCWRTDSVRDHSTEAALFRPPPAADSGRWLVGEAGRWGWSYPPAEQPSRWALCDASWWIWKSKVFYK